LEKKCRAGRGKDPVVDLSATLALILKHLDQSLCDQVFKDVRDKQRQRTWTLFLLARFWLQVVIEAPRSLRQVLSETRPGDGTLLLPGIVASQPGFSQRCATLPSTFFAVLYSEFVARLRKDASPCYASDLRALRNRFTEVLVVDGSRLDKIAHRLKILWNEKAPVLPGCILALYDLFYGVAKQIFFTPDAAASEHEQAVLAFQTLKPGSLVVGDRLYCTLELFQLLENLSCYGVFRRSKTLKLKRLRLLSRSTQPDGTTLEDWLVEVGTDERKRTLRMILAKKKNKTHSVLTNVLDPKLLSAAEANKLYRRRWSIERLFFDLKEVLNLNRLYAANPNGAAMQVFATAMVHAAFRVVQGRVARQVKLEPERLSPAKLFPRIAVACMSMVEFEFVFLEVSKANPGVRLRKPPPSAARNQRVLLSAILVEPRKPKRRRKKRSAEKGKWKSFKHIRGGQKLT